MNVVCVLCLYVSLYTVNGNDESNDLDSEDKDGGSFNATDFFTNTTDDIDDSEERIGAAVTQVFKHPYAASLLKNDTFVCSAVILNTYWVLTLTKCFDSSVMSSYVSHKYLSNYTIRSGSNYNNKGGNISKIKLLVSNYDFKVCATKLAEPLVFDARVQAVNIPRSDDEVSLGYLTSLIAWTPTGHIRVVNAPVIDPTICDSTKLLPGNYICIGGVQDPNRHFCRKDNGGAVIQNNTLIAITAFLHTCALYTKTHAFPKAASFAKWVDTVIWDEDNRPTTTTVATTTTISTTEDRSPYFGDPRKFMLTLPFDPVNLPLQPAEDNSVLPRMSLYESYLHNLAVMRTSTTVNPKIEEKRKWLEKFGKMVSKQFPKKYDFDYN